MKINAAGEAKELMWGKTNKAVAAAGQFQPLLGNALIHSLSHSLSRARSHTLSRILALSLVRVLALARSVDSFNVLQYLCGRFEQQE